MVRKLMLIGLMAVLVLAVAAPAVARNADPGGRGAGPVIYVTSQGKFYDSVVVATVPNKGNFQVLEKAGPSPSGLQTEFGPGDVGYLGGRWALDEDGDGTIDVYFVCPLLGPGRGAP